MKSTITLTDFRNEFYSYNRSENFSYEGLEALYYYLTELEEDCGIDIELDVIALCCEFTEYADLEEIQSNYTDIEDLEDLQDHTQVIEFTGGIIIQNY